MRVLAVISIQAMIYSIFTIVEMLSNHDRIYAKGLLSIVFIYLAYIAANANGYSTKKSAKLTFATLIIFIVVQRISWWILEFI
ncbi:hypothetical protein [Bacillus suaedaesalsae]|uniref:Uncharacterized protein n=1 Tax=Bacillus suaedaesalsae TaxID=2810349 RepID=A0ABS2DJF3_9BACI|nr:hypothetical protein [Bacillus suaedaesalsae]MBM6618620.1 hypothetical protein [Bacillus suaedaesalsae]